MPQACVERALPRSTETRRFAHTKFLQNELPARALWKAKRPGGLLVVASARRGRWSAVQVRRWSFVRDPARPGLVPRLTAAMIAFGSAVHENGFGARLCSSTKR